MSTPKQRRPWGQIPKTAVLKKFTCFSNLPAELRLKIIQATFPRGNSEDRKERRGLRHTMIDFRHDHSPSFFIQTWASTPFALWINHEFREETLRHYRKLFDYADLPRSLHAPRSTPMFYNPKLDIIELSGPQLNDYYADKHYERTIEALDWISDHAQNDLIAIKSLEIHSHPFPEDDDRTFLKFLNHETDAVFRYLQHWIYFRRLAFLNIIDCLPWTLPETVPSCGSWVSPDRAISDRCKSEIQAEQKTNPDVMIPSIRFAPANNPIIPTKMVFKAKVPMFSGVLPWENQGFIEYVLSNWPEHRRTGREGLDPFTDITSEDRIEDVTDEEDTEMTR